LAARQGRRRSGGDPLGSAFCLPRLQKKLSVNFGNGRRLGAVQASWYRDRALAAARNRAQYVRESLHYLRSRRWVSLN
jgi:hypothetical protein